MSTNGQLVFTDVDKITFKGVGNASNAVVDTLTGKIGVGVDSPDANLHVVGNSYVSTNLELGGTLIMGTVNVEAQHSLEAVTATGNTTPLTIEFTNPTTGIVATGNVEVGGDVVLSGNIYNNANLSVQYTTITPTLWTQVGSDIDGEAAGDWSGYSVSISSDGTRVAIGGPYNDGTGSNAGHVRVYSESGGTWTQVGSDIDGEAAGDRSGYSVSISSDGTRVAIGATYNDGTGSNAGHVRVYAESGGTWTQVGADIDGEAADDYSGQSVSMSSDGTRVAIGAYKNDGTGSDAGHVRVYSESGGTWTQVGADIDGEAASDRSGHSVSMSSDGTRVAIGAQWNDGNGSDVGHVRVYYESGGTWTQVGSDIDGEAVDDEFGWSVSMSSDGTRVAIGAPVNDGTTGHVRVYSESGGTWTQVGSDIDGEAAGDYSGQSVSMSSDGTRVAIGAPWNDPSTGSNAGHVRVYAESGGTWTQVGSDIDGEGEQDKSGQSVSMSSDGTRVAIGAYGNDPGQGYAAIGHVRVFDWPMIKSKKILKDDIVEVSGELIVSGNTTVSENLTVSGELIVSGTGALTIPSGTTEQQPSTGLVGGMIRFNSTTNRLEVYNGTAWQSMGGVSATGGTITTSGGYRIHTFTSSGDLVVNSGGEVDYLIVAGGGGGGSGGGGAGGMLTGKITSLSPNTYTITVGAGGGGGRGGSPVATPTPSNGTNSTALGLTAIGGGRGGGGSISGRVGSNGGSGGGHGYDITGSTRTTGTSGQGNGGGRASGPSLGGSGGGGGAGGVGHDGGGSIPHGSTSYPSYGGNGGIGLQSSISGTSTYYAGGGGGGLNQNNNITYSRPIGQTYGGYGGQGGGGTGTTKGWTSNNVGEGTAQVSPTAGAPNTGGGGGGTDPELDNGAGGGTGIVIISYLS